MKPTSINPDIKGRNIRVVRARYMVEKFKANIDLKRIIKSIDSDENPRVIRLTFAGIVG
jgi:hypothetical protein